MRRGGELSWFSRTQSRAGNRSRTGAGGGPYPIHAKASAVSSAAPASGVSEKPSTSQAPLSATAKRLTAPQTEPSAAATRSASLASDAISRRRQTPPSRVMRRSGASRASTAEAAERIALGADRLLENQALPVVLVAIEGGAHHRLDLAALRALDVAVGVQPVVGAHGVEHLMQRQGAVLQREPRHLDAAMPLLEPGEDVALH